MKVLIFGQGKTGTTVIAKTIQHSLPGARFSMEPRSEEAIPDRDDRSLVAKILHGQWSDDIDGLTRILRNDSGVRFDRIVKVLRDPRDQAVSLLLYKLYGLALEGRTSDEQLRELTDLIRAKENTPADFSFGKICDEFNRILGWRGFTRRWLICESGMVANKSYWDYLHFFDDCGHFLRYEDFVRGDLAKLESYLGLPLSDDRDVGPFSRTHRSGRSGSWREFFTAEDVAELRPLTEALYAQMGYRDWELRPQEKLNPEHYSGYVERIIAEGRSERSAA